MNNLNYGDVAELLRSHGLGSRPSYKRVSSIEEMQGEIFLDYAYWREQMVFVTNQAVYLLQHDQSCCENVEIEDMLGDLEDFKGQYISLAEEVTNRDTPRDPSDAKYGDFLWTYYKLGCVKGYFDVRWYGTSNGYYSEDVTVYRWAKKSTEGDSNEV